jgi:hypothetical protein
LAGNFDDLHVSGGDNYTHSANSTQAPFVSESKHLESAQIDYNNPYNEHQQYGSSPAASFQTPHSTETYEQSQVYGSSQHDHNQSSRTATAPSTIIDNQQTHSNAHRYIAGTPAKGTSEKIDKSYQIRTKDYKKFFKVGRVFSTLWTEGLGGNVGKFDPTFISVVRFGEKVHTKVRRFVVVREGNRSVTCLPVTSYDRAGPSKAGIQLSDHGFIYSRRVPTTVEGMIPTALKVNISKGAAHLQDPSLINYAKVYTVETNVKVKDVGDLDSDSKNILLYYFQYVFWISTGSDNNRPDTSGATGSVLTGVGGATARFSLPPPATTYNTPMTSPSSSMGITSNTVGHPPYYQHPNQSTNPYGSSNNRAGEYQQLPSGAEYGTSTAGYGNSFNYPSNQGSRSDSTSAYNPTTYSSADNQYSNAPINTASTYSVTYAQAPQLQNTYESPSYQPAFNHPSHVTSSDYQADSYGSGYSTQNQYGQSSSYNESALEDDEDIELPTLQSAQQDSRQRRESRSHRSGKEQRRKR